jgi:hypothetical protein
MMPDSHCDFSEDRTYRYTLWRQWGCTLNNYVQFIGLNPSTADETKNDPTVRRCINYAKAWGYGGMCMTNLFAFRATDPADMKVAVNPVGPLNDSLLLAVSGGTNLVMACWGTHGAFQGREQAVLRLLAHRPLHCLKITANGHPSHPLYLKKDLAPVHFVHKA